MRKNITLLILLIACPISGFLMANPVTESQAYAVAANFFRANNAKAGATTLGDKAVQTSVAFDELYIFCGTDNHGFVIVSADDCVTPILGYSYESTFDPDNMPPQLIWWLQRYDDMIRQSRTNPSAQSQPHPEWDNLLQSKGTKDSEHQPIVGPLITTTWNQYGYTDPYSTEATSDCTYNRFCISGQAVTGCVATAGAQIMKYWNHPSTGRGSHTYTIRQDNPHFAGLQLSADFANTHYDWDHMPTRLTISSTETENNAVAILMYHVGVAVNMDYGINESGAYSERLENAFKEYFKYSNDISYEYASYYEMEEWKTMLKNELDAQRPVIYSGFNNNSDAGHCFICDGYDNCDYFHFNWGWGGHSDGFFNIENPDPNGTYNRWKNHCSAIIGIEPNYGEMPSEDGTTELYVVPNNPDFGSTTGSGTYSNYQWIPIEPHPKPGYKFVQWNDGSRYPYQRSIMTYGGRQTYTAFFEEDLDNNTLGYYDPHSSSSSSFKGAAVRISPSEMASTTFLNGVRYVHNNNNTSLTLEIRQGGDNPTNGTLLHTQTGNYGNSSGWYWDTIIFDTPIPVNTSQPLWIVLRSDNNSYLRLYYNYSNSNNDYDSSFWSIPYSGTAWETTSNRFHILAITTLADHDPVQNLQATPVSNNTVHITWDAPTSSTPTAYTLAIGTSNDPYSLPTFNVTNTWYDLTMDDTWTNYLNTTLTELMQNNTYKVYVRASYTNPYGQEYHSRWKSVTFNYAYHDANRVAIYAVPNDETLGYVTGSGVYPIGSTVTLEATPYMNGFFMGWNEGNTGGETITFTATESTTYTANFGRMSATVGIDFNQMQGTVQINGQEVYPGYHYEYPMFSTIKVQAIPAEGYQFDCWDDGVTNNPRFINLKYTMEDPTIITALFSDSQNSKNYRVKTCQNQVEILTTEYSKVQIFDMLGRRVYIGQSQAQSTTSLTLDRKGVYIVKVGENEAEKIIIL